MQNIETVTKTFHKCPTCDYLHESNDDGSFSECNKCDNVVCYQCRISHKARCIVTKKTYKQVYVLSTSRRVVAVFDDKESAFKCFDSYYEKNQGVYMAYVELNKPNDYNPEDDNQQSN
jgi:hypothetical protein